MGIPCRLRPRLAAGRAVRISEPGRARHRRGDHVHRRQPPVGLLHPRALLQSAVTVELELTPEARTAVDRVAELARERFAPRAGEYDRAASFPEADFADLFEAG